MKPARLTQRRTLFFIATATISVTLAGCGGSSDQPTVTAAQALDKVNSYLDQTIKATGGNATFQKTLSTSNYQGGCVGDGVGAGSPGQVEAQVVYTTTTETGNAHLTALRSYWTKQNYSVTTGGNDLDAYTGDNYHLSATYYPDRHELDITGSSFCVWPNGSPPTS
jgi:hypothetical protein